jgi:hypothetical protein
MKMDREIKELLESKGFKHVSEWNDNGTECNIFRNGSDILKIEYTEDADEEILEEIGEGE